MTDDQLLDFDSIDVWFPLLTSVLDPQLPPDIGDRLERAKPEFIEDARDLVFQLADRERIIDAVIDWIRASQLLAYHGTRLTDSEVQNVATYGLKPLTVEDRRGRILRSLSSHNRWNAVAGRLDSVLRAYGSGNVAGSREGDVHLTVSRSGLTQGFNHYLTHGAEVDQHIAFDLLGDEGKDRLRYDGNAPVELRSDSCHLTEEDLKASIKGFAVLLPERRRTADVNGQKCHAPHPWRGCKFRVLLQTFRGWDVLAGVQFSF